MSTFAENLDAIRDLGPEGLARFAASLEPGWIDEALAATGKASIRRRKILAQHAIWLVLGMGLFEDRSIRDVVDHLGLVVDGVRSLAPSSVSKARYRLGAEPLEWLFRKVSDTWVRPSTTGLTGWRGLRLFGVDGTCLRVQDSDENFDHFGKPGGRGGAGDAGYPQLRLAALLDLDSRLLLDAKFGPYVTSERELAESLWPSIPENSITILDRGFIDFLTLSTLHRTGGNRHVLVRMRENMRADVAEVLSDGTELVDLKPSTNVVRDHPGTGLWRVRVVHYQHPGGRAGRLMTTLLDPDEYPANELIRLYHERWEIELAFDELKTHMIESRKNHLRSKRPSGVEQEVWGLLLVYNLVRREMLLAAQSFEVHPRRISFRSSLQWIRNFWLCAWRTRAGNIPKSLGAFRSTLDVLIIPKRRSDRRYPRHVKIKMSNYARNRGKRKQKTLK